MRSNDRDTPRLGQAKRTPTKRMVPAQDQCRCGCGSLLARVVREGLELKCRKCKSLILITHDELVAMYHRLKFHPLPTPSFLDRRER